MFFSIKYQVAGSKTFLIKHKIFFSSIPIAPIAIGGSRQQDLEKIVASSITIII